MTISKTPFKGPFCLSIFLIFLVSSFGWSQNVALLIGNADYGEGNSLETPLNDVDLIELKLKSEGYAVIKVKNATKEEILNKLEWFKDLPYPKTRFFYYHGHTITLGNINYLIPIDADLENIETNKLGFIPIDEYINQFSEGITFHIQGWYKNKFTSIHIICIIRIVLDPDLFSYKSLHLELFPP